MKVFTLFEAIGELPADTIEMKRKKTGKKVWAVSSMAAAIFLVSVITIGVGISMHNKNNLKEGVSAVFGPVTAFGISPITEGTTELVSEDVIFTKNENRTETINGIYNVKMAYHVNTHANTEFILPYPSIEDNTPVEIYVDGVMADFSSDVHPNAYVNRPMVYKGAKLQSIIMPPKYENLETQPENTYDILMQSYTSGQQSSGITLDTIFRVYDISNVTAQPQRKEASFEAIGDLDQLRLLFTNRTCEINGYEMDYVNKKDNIGNSKYYIGALDNKPEQKMWLAVLNDSPQLDIKVNGNNIVPETMTLSTILTENLYLSEEAQQNYLKNFSVPLMAAKKDGQVHVMNGNLTTTIHNRMAAQGMGVLNMYRFTIDTPGEHVITVSLKATGEDITSPDFMLQYASAPTHMWSQAGSRKLSINIANKNYSYNITDSLFHFNMSKDAE